MASEKETLGSIRVFRRKAAALCRRFRHLPCEIGEAALLSEEAKAAYRSLASVSRLPQTGGIPRMARDMCDYLEAQNGVPTQGTLLRFLSERDEGYSDDEMALLRSFLVLGMLDRAEKTSEIGALSALPARLCEIDFEALFFAGSAVEKQFLREEDGSYRDSDRKTKHLYHRRLSALVGRKCDGVALARRLVSEANRRKLPLCALLKPVRSEAPRLYFYFGAVLTLLFASLFCVLAGRAALLLPLLLFPIWALVKALIAPFFSDVGEKMLPRLRTGEAMRRTRVLLSVATFLGGEQKDGAIFDRLEDFYLTCHAENVCFAVLGDLPQSERRTSDKDEAIAAYARCRIEALNRKYGGGFALFVRGRRYARCEDAYIGWERKRGGVLELCRFLRGKKTSFRLVVGDEAFLRDVRYLITLDGDTRLYAGAVSDLLGTALHPENRPTVDPVRHRVTAGHAIIQPRVLPTLASVSRSAFARLTGGAGGLDPYAGAASDLYQQVFDEGIFCGKGILDVDAYLALCDGFFPNERILSHDLLEGNLLRSALACDIVLTDSTPSTARAYYLREHRWIRGDLQILPYLKKRVETESGKTVRNPLSPLSKFKIADNIFRAATPLCAVSALFLSFFFGARAALCAFFFAFGYLLFPIPAQLFAVLRAGNFGALFRRFYTVTLPHFTETVVAALFRLAAAPYDGALFADAAVRTLYRFFVSRKNFLNWVSASDAERRTDGTLERYFLRMAPSVLAGALALALPIGAFRLLGLLWIFFPSVLWALSQKSAHNPRVRPASASFLTESAHRMWLYFRTYVNEKTHFLPPDNVQFSPVERIAERTSPTNIGLYLLSVLAARDLHFLATDEMYAMLSATAKTLSHLHRWNGHFYNWYDLSTLAVIGEPFVSTVDSGNLVTSLVALCEGLREYVGECPALLDVIRQFEAIVAETDFSSLYDPVRRLFRVGYNGREGRFSDACYDMLMSEARTTSFYAVASGAVPREHYFALSRCVIAAGGRIGIASWGGTAFEYFMPSLLLPTEENSLTDEALAFAFRGQLGASLSCEALGHRRRIFGISESGYFGFDYEMNYQYSAFGAERLSKNPEMRTGRVIAPYASFLMWERDPQRVQENLTALKRLGLFGKYGFYEALDLDPARVGNGYAIIKSYMAHHVGMSLLACANVLSGGIFRRRFFRNPMMRASEELLCERIPVGARSEKRKKGRRTMPVRAPLPIAPVRETARYPYNLISPESALLSNNKTKLFATTSGHIELVDGMTALSCSEFRRYTLGGGLRVYADIDGKSFGAVPLSAEPAGFSARYDVKIKPDRIEYIACHTGGRLCYTVSVCFAVCPNREIYKITCKIAGAFRRARFCLSFEPILEERKRYLAGKSFSGLFLESRYDSDEKILCYKRRPQSDGKAAKLLGVSAFPEAEERSFATMREDALPLMATERDYAALAGKKLSGREGAVVIPFCAIQSRALSPKRALACFFIGCSDDEEELLYCLSAEKEKSASKERLAMGDLLQLQYATAGLGENVSALERCILRGIHFGAAKAENAATREMPIRRDDLWKHGISGDNPIVTAHLTADNAEQRARLQVLIRLFKYMCIRGVRYDFVIFYAENDAYHAPIRHALEEMIRRAGCENFLSFSGGIFPIARADADEAVLRSYDAVSAATFDLSVPPEVTASANPHFVPISNDVEALLKREASVCIGERQAPRLSETARVCGGFFHREGFLVEKPHRNTPWAHILASENFGSVLTENALGFTFAGNAGLRKLTPHGADGMREDAGERLLLRFYDDTGSCAGDVDLCAASRYWNVGFGFAEYFGTAEDVEYSVRVAPIGKFRMKRISVSLSAKSPREAALFYRTEPCLGSAPAPHAFYAYRREKDALCVERRDGASLGIKTALFSPHAFFYTDETALQSDGKLFDGRETIAAAGVKLLLSERITVDFFLAAYRGALDFAALRALVSSGNLPEYRVPPALFETLTLQTPSRSFDEIAGRWALYQTLYSRIFARSGFYQVSGAYGFRDQLQDALSLLPVLPELSKVLILRAAARQYETGAVQHWWHAETGAGLMTRCSDDFLWLPYVVTAYAEQTGDERILDIRLPYLVSSPLGDVEPERYERVPFSEGRESLFAHLLRAASYGMRFGAHGLPLMGSGDWNDGMNAVGRLGRGESVWLAFFEAIVFHRLSVLCEKRGECEAAEKLRAQVDALSAAIERYAFDGAWYLRGFYDDGTALGSAARGDCKIDALPQAFALMTKSLLHLDKTRVMRAGDALYGILFDRKNGLMKLIAPAFSDDAQSPGYIKGYVPGLRENGGQYTHAAIWASIGFFAAEENERGTEILLALNPAERCLDAAKAARYRIEPYVLAGDIYSHPTQYGRGGWSWYTGSASWYRIAVTEVLCGYTPRGDGFFLRPHFSERFPHFSMTVRRKNTLYRIEAAHAVVASLTLDGEAVPIEDPRAFFFPFDGGEHEIRMTL